MPHGEQPADAATTVQATGQVMGTTYTVVVHVDDTTLIPQAERLLIALEQRWSRFLPDSEISILNRAGGRPVIVSPETVDVVRAAIDGCRATNGRFDPTVHDAMVAAGYDRTFDDLATADVIDMVTRATNDVVAPGIDGIDIDDDLHAITMPPGTRIDLGGIGKGTAADLAAVALVGLGARGAAVSVGGDVRVIGDSPTGGGWRPEFLGEPLDLPMLIEGGICTSTGDRRRWHTPEGVRHHLLDPANGQSLDNDIASVTVVAATAQQAEILTKAAMVAGEDAESLLASFGVAAVVRRLATAATV